MVLDLSNFLSASMFLSPINHGQQAVLVLSEVLEENNDDEDIEKVVGKYFKNSSVYQHKYTKAMLIEFLKDHKVVGRVGSKLELSKKAYDIIKNM